MRPPSIYPAAGSPVVTGVEIPSALSVYYAPVVISALEEITEAKALGKARLARTAPWASLIAIVDPVEPETAEETHP